VRTHLRDFEQLRVSPAAFLANHGVADPAVLSGYVHPPERDAMVALEWDSFCITQRADSRAAGFCGRRKLPDSTGAVEIAYGLAPAYQGKGLATEAARALVQDAMRSSQVKAVVAHTLPEMNASGRVLAKCGFVRAGEAVDPDEGVVWKWQLTRSARDTTL
jgi:[ribosomal protein S5]-alanine N-acetyltransferase